MRRKRGKAGRDTQPHRTAREKRPRQLVSRLGETLCPELPEARQEDWSRSLPFPTLPGNPQRLPLPSRASCLFPGPVLPWLLPWPPIILSLRARPNVPLDAGQSLSLRSHHSQQGFVKVSARGWRKARVAEPGCDVCWLWKELHVCSPHPGARSASHLSISWIEHSPQHIAFTV